MKLTFIIDEKSGKAAVVKDDSMTENDYRRAVSSVAHLAMSLSIMMSEDEQQESTDSAKEAYRTLTGREPKKPTFGMGLGSMRSLGALGAGAGYPALSACASEASEEDSKEESEAPTEEAKEEEG